MGNKRYHSSGWLWFDRTLSQNLGLQIIVLFCILLFAFVISFVLLEIFGGNWGEYCEHNEISKWVFPLYLLIDDNAFSNFYMNSRNYSIGALPLFISGIIYVAGIIIFTGMIISLMSNMIQRRVEAHRKGETHYLKQGHYIIMGYDEMLPSFITHIFRKDPGSYILILSSVATEYIKEHLDRTFDKDQMKHVIINHGARVSQETFKDIHLESAKQVYILGNRSMPALDAVNVECVDNICAYLQTIETDERPKRITCLFKDLDTYAAFKTCEIFGKVNDLNIEFMPYNFYTGWAKQVFVKRFYRDAKRPEVRLRYPSVYGDGITPDDNKFVHLVFVGTTNFAVAFAMEAAHILHFPNFNREKPLRTRITFIDVNADKEKGEFITRNRHFFDVQSYRYYDLTGEKGDPKNPVEELFKRRQRRNPYIKPTNADATQTDFLDVEFEFIKGNIFDSRVQDEICDWAGDTEHQYLSIFLALSDQRSNFVMGMNMPDRVYENKVPIFIRQQRSDNFVTNLRIADIKDDADKFTYAHVVNGQLVTDKRDGRYANIYPFGMNEMAYSADNMSLKRAKLIHYLYSTADYDNYKFQSLLALESMAPDTIWAEAEEEWKKLNVALKWSNLYSAYSIKTKLASLRAMRGVGPDDETTDTNRLSDDEVELMAKVEHNRWNVEKLLMGYRVPRPDENPFEQAEDFEESLKKNKKLFIHHDIRCFDDLKSIQELDREFSRYIPWIVKMTARR